MTPEQYLEGVERRTRERLLTASRETASAVETVVDVPGWVRRRPLLTLGGGAAAGFVAGSTVFARGRRVARRVTRSALVPLLRPTLAALGSALAGALVGEPHPHD